MHKKKREQEQAEKFFQANGTRTYRAIAESFSDLDT